MAAAVAERSLGERVTDWTDETLPPSITDAVDAVMGFVPADEVVRHRSNVVRLHLLHAFGGTWIDHDFILLSRSRSGEIAAHPDGTVCPCYMSFPRGHALIGEALARVAPGPTAMVASGAALLNKVFDSTVKRRPLPITHQGEGLTGAPQQIWGFHFSLRS